MPVRRLNQNVSEWLVVRPSRHVGILAAHSRAASSLVSGGLAAFAGVGQAKRTNGKQPPDKVVAGTMAKSAITFFVTGYWAVDATE
jgi:hypothetical protein